MEPGNIWRRRKEGRRATSRRNHGDVDIPAEKFDAFSVEQRIFAHLSERQWQGGSIGDPGPNVVAHGMLR
jgi:hypothetical protein